MAAFWYLHSTTLNTTAMNAIIRSTSLFCCMLFAFGSAMAQQETLIDVIKNGSKTETFADAKTRVDAFFNQFTSETEKNRKGYKQWKRWEWFASLHLDPDGKVGAWSERNDAALSKIALMPELSAPNGSWFSQGPGSISNGENYLGRVECIGFHPSDANTLYVGSATGGLWKTTNLGASWSALTDHLPSLSIGGVAVSPSNGNVVYILTGDGDGGNQWGYYVKERSSGVFRSTDGGNTWFPSGLQFDRSGETVYGYKLLIQPNNSSVLFAATSNGIYRTANSGSTWDLVQAGEFTDIEFKPNDFNRLAASRYGFDDLYISTDNGLTWRSKDVPGGSNMTRGELAVSANQTNRVYYLMGPETSGGFRGYYYYQWSDSSFTLIANTPNVFTGATDGSGDGGFPWWAIALGVEPTDANIQLIGGVIGRRSITGGTTIFADHDILHADAHGYYFSPVDGSAFAVNDGGIFRSTNFGNTWTNLTTNMRITQYYRISTTPQNTNMVLGGTQDNGHHVRTTATSAFKWVRTCCDGMDNAIDPTNAAILYSCTQDGGLGRSIDGGDNWTDIRPLVSGNRVGGEWVSPFLLHSSTPTTLFFAGDGGIFRSTNSGTSWTNIGADGDDAMDQGVSNTARFYAAKGTTFRRSDDVNDATPTWTIKSGTTGWPTGNLANAKITSIAVHPQNSLEVWVTLSGYNDGFKVLRSTNGGDSWTNVTGSLPNVPVHVIKHESQPGSSTYQVYIGTDIGVFFRSNSSGDWVFYSNYLPRVIVTDLEIVGSSIYAGTYGRGIWSSTLESGCAASAILSSTYEGAKVFQSGTSIVSAGTILSGTGTNITMRAGSYVDLTEGFHAQFNTIFTAQVGPCNATLPLPGGAVPIEGGNQN